MKEYKHGLNCLEFGSDYGMPYLGLYLGRYKIGITLNVHKLSDHGWVKIIDYRGTKIFLVKLLTSNIHIKIFNPDSEITV